MYIGYRLLFNVEGLYARVATAQKYGRNPGYEYSYMSSIDWHLKQSCPAKITMAFNP